MAYNYYGQNYGNPYGYQQSYQPPMQIQNGGFISVRSEEEARNYAVAPGMSVTFINENAPYCYTKTMGFSQLDRPRFEKYRMVKEEDAVQAHLKAQEGPPQEGDKFTIAYATKDDLEALRKELEAIRAEVNGKKATAKIKKEAESDV